MTNRTPLRPLAGLAVTLAVLFSACGDSDNSTESTDTAVTAEVIDTADPTTPSSAPESSADEAEPADTSVETPVDTTPVEPSETEPTETGTGDGATDPEPATTPDGVTSEYLASYSLVDDEFGTMVTVTVAGATRTIETNALPDHETGDFPNSGNPNEISEQDLTWEFPTEPVLTGNATEVRVSGVAVNGVKFEPGTAETLTCSSGENYRIEALQDIYDLGLDFNNAHVQPTGEYHYHGISSLLVGAYETDEDLVHIGFASDGHLIYYSKSGAYDSGYALSTDDRSGTDCLASGPDGTTIDVDGTTPDGTYTSDWIWSEDTGDLDVCNGTTIDGEYVYLVTDTYPYVTRCMMGEVSGEGVGAAPADGGAAPGAAPAGAPDFSEAAAALGVTEAELLAVVGPNADLDAAAAQLGVTVEDLRAALPPPPGG